MVSTYSYIPMFETDQTIQSNERSKEALTSCIKEAVNKVHNVATFRNASDNEILQSNVPEVWQLCQSLDKALLHGLKQLPFGYWPFVKEFTHLNCRSYLENLENVKSSLGRSRSWLCQALNENTLESYISSFLGNPKVLEKHYLQPALLRDTQRMQLVLTLMAGLEYVGFDMPVDLSTWDTLGFANFTIKPDCDSDLDTLSATSSSVCLESKSTCTSGATPVSMRSLVDEDSTEPMSIESAFEATNEQILSNIDDCLPDCACSNCNFKASLIEQQQRVSHLIGLDPDKISSDDSSDTTLEVVHARFVKTRRRKLKSELSEDSYENNNIPSGDEVSSKCSADDEKELKRLTEANNCDKDGLDSGIDGQHASERELPLDLGWLGEREAPEGQEDPKSSSSDCLTEISSQGLKGKRELSHDEELSIYDVGLMKKKEIKDADDGVLKDGDDAVIKDKGDATIRDGDDAGTELRRAVAIGCEMNLEDELKSADEVEGEIKEMKDDVKSTEMNHWMSELSITSSSTSYDEKDLETLREESQLQDRSFKVDNNILLYLSLEIFQRDEEQLYKVFLASTRHGGLNGPESTFVVLTNYCLYLLLRGNEKIGRFRTKSIIPFDLIDTIIVNLNYQSFLVQCKGILKCTILTGSDFLTRSIISNLDVSMRRNGFKSLPSVVTFPSLQVETLNETLRKELQINCDQVELGYFALVHWENYTGISPATTPAGPIQEGFMMYKHKLSGIKTWTPAYFQLKAGVLYCFKDSDAQTPDFYFQLHFPHFNGCRRSQNSHRPHAFELQMRGKEKLMLAAANDIETSMWLQAILQTVALFGRLTDTGPKSVSFCSILLSNQVFFILSETGTNLKLLGKASVADLAAVRIDIDSPTLCVLEFESGEANNCSGDWIVLFSDIDEKEKFLSTISLVWEDLFQVPLNVSALKDLSLWSRCREHYQLQKQNAEEMAALLKDDS